LTDESLRLIAEADGVVVVDKGAGGRFGVATTAVLAHLAASDRLHRLHLVVTKMDRVLEGGGDVEDFESAERRVVASADNVADGLAGEIGPAASRALRARLDTHTRFTYAADRSLQPEDDMGAETIRQLEALRAALVAA
jgi:hypothetical protein